ncbi:copper resistance CopC/CopD family protein [Paenibacillus crassostreae]|uniref:copper resistance CopC/CopD family protein n=1 Tax=Paenibacillus crassostreae TaxID=1763538 RepID=UPI0013906AC5|nr:copper resistance protein CopC [Paenibacillus crassostreae]
MKNNHKLLILGLVLSFIWMFLYPSFSYAHAYLQQSSPSANDIISQSPSKITLQFNESVQPSFHSILVTNSSGERVELDDSYIPDDQLNRLESNLKPNLPDGLYVIQWNVISGDGHPIEGDIPFQVGEGNHSTVVPSANTTKKLPSGDYIAVRWLLYLGISFLMGILSFYLFMYPANPKGKSPLPRRSRTLLWISYCSIAVSVVLSLPLQATINAHIHWLELWTTPWFDQILRTNFGPIWLVQIVLVTILGGSLYSINRSVATSRSRMISLSVAYSLGLGILLSKSFIGHSAVSEFKILSVTMNFLHLAAICIWIGSLLAIAVILPKEASLPSLAKDRNVVISHVIHLFSYWGTGLVATMLVSGIYASLKYVPTLYSLFNTLYGQVLLLKCGLVVIMLVLAAFNYLRGRKKKSLGRSVWIELSMGVIILVLAAILTHLPTAMASPGPIQATNTLANGEAITIRISPNVVGINEFEIDIHDVHGQEIRNIQQVKLTLTSLDMDMGKYEIILPSQPSSTFLAQDLISMAGSWKVQVHILTESLDAWDTEFTIRVGTE